MPALSVLAHHSEPSDPELLRWIIDTIDSILGWGPATFVVPIAVLLLVFPAAIAVLSLRRRRRVLQDDAQADEADETRDGRLAR